MSLLAKLAIVSGCLLGATSPALLAQPVTKVPPARVVLVFNNDPKSFSSLLIDGAPFAKLTFAQDRATAWPAPAGSHTLTVQAPETLPKDLNLNLGSGQTYLLSLGLIALPAPARPGSPSKQITASLTPLALPAPDDKVRAFVFMAPSAKPIRAELLRGAARDSKSSPFDLAPGKMIPLGVGGFSLLVGGKPLIFLNSTSPGLYVYLLFPDAHGQLVPRSFVVFSDLDEEKETTPKSKGSPTPGATRP